MNKFSDSSDKYGDYTPGEIVFIIELLSAMRPIDEIQERFHKFTLNQKRIHGSKIIEIERDHSSRIKRQREMYLKNVKGNPLAHPKVVLDILYDIVLESRKPRPVNSVKVGDNEFQIVEKTDNETAIRAIKTAVDYMSDLEKLSMAKSKLPKDDKDIEEALSSWQIEDGLALEESE
jgi:hypothetical protein